MRIVSNVLGVLFILAGLAGFASHNMMGMHLSTTHNIIHLVTGALSLWFGMKGTERGVRNWCRTIGVIYGLLGLIGFFFPGGTVTLKALAGQYESHLMKIIPGHLELGTADDTVHLIVGIIYLIAGFLPRNLERKVGETTEAAKQKVAGGR